MTRRLLHLSLPVLAAMLLVAACGADDDTASAADDGDVEAATDETAAAFPVTIEHKYGETVIDAAAERIVVVGLLEQDALLALGEAPIATTEWFGEHPGAIWPWAQDELEALDADVPEVLDATDGYNIEAVAAQRPDLILALYSEISDAEYEKLSAIAPTVAQPDGYVDYGIPWDEMTLTVGRAVGKADEAQAIVDDIGAMFDAAVDDHPEFAGASAVVATPYDGVYLYGPDDVRGRLLTRLGFTLPADLVEVTGEDYGGTISVENIDYIDLDVVVWLDYAEAEGQAGVDVYEALPVHTEGREVLVDSYRTALGGATSFVTPLSLPFLLEELVPRLALAIDGDPATEVPVAQS